MKTTKPILYPLADHLYKVFKYIMDTDIYQVDIDTFKSVFRAFPYVFTEYNTGEFYHIFKLYLYDIAIEEFPLENLEHYYMDYLAIDLEDLFTMFRQCIMDTDIVVYLFNNLTISSIFKDTKTELDCINNVLKCLNEAIDLADKDYTPFLKDLTDYLYAKIN